MRIQTIPVSNATISKKYRRVANYSRRVMLDTSVLVSYVRSKRDGTIVKKVVTKSHTEDTLMMTNLLRDEVLKYADRSDNDLTREDIEFALDELNPIIQYVDPVENEALIDQYRIRDQNDLKILYSVDTTESEILVTYDDDFFAVGVEGIEAEIMDPVAYLYEDDIRNKTYVPDSPKIGRIVRIRKRGTE